MLACVALHRQRRPRADQLGVGIHALLFVQMPGQGRGHIGLALMVSDDEPDGAARGRAAEVLDGHLGGDHRALAGHIAIATRQIGHHTYPQLIVGQPSLGHSDRGHGQPRGQQVSQLHENSPYEPAGATPECGPGGNRGGGPLLQKREIHPDGELIGPGARNRRSAR